MTMPKDPLDDLCRQCRRSVLIVLQAKRKLCVHVIYQQFSFGTVVQRDGCVIPIYRMT